jgi:hypothetical protein
MVIRILFVDRVAVELIGGLRSSFGVDREIKSCKAAVEIM